MTPKFKHTLAIGLRFKTTASGLKPNGTIYVHNHNGNKLSPNQVRHRISVKDIKPKYDHVLGLLSSQFPILLHPQLVYIGTVRHRRENRDIYVPQTVKNSRIQK